MNALEKKFKHLDYIQGVITRMNANSFMIKGWSVAVVSALFALSAKDTNYRFTVIAFVAIFLFWGLDAYYLSQERQFRDLYDAIRVYPDTQETDLSMDASAYNKGNKTWLACLVQPTVLLPNLFLLLASLVVLWILKGFLE